MGTGVKGGYVERLEVWMGTAKLTRATASALLVAAVSVWLAGCGSASPTATVASLGGHSGTHHGGVSLLSGAQSDRDMIAFARCMRTHGVDVPDPFHRPGHEGLSVDVPPHDAATRAAYSACNGLIASIIEIKQAGGASRVAPEIPALTRYAECMRRHDIPLLDPTPLGAVSLGSVPGITSDVGRYSPQFRQADAVCRVVLPASIHDDGTGP